MLVRLFLFEITFSAMLLSIIVTGESYADENDNGVKMVNVGPDSGNNKKHVQFESSLTTDVNKKRELTIAAFGVLKSVSVAAERIAPWKIGSWKANISTKVKCQNIQKSDQEAKTYTPRFFGKAGPKNGRGGQVANDYEWSVDGEYSVVRPIRLEINFPIDPSGNFDPSEDTEYTYYVETGTIGDVKELFQDKLKMLNEKYKDQHQVPMEIVFNCHGLKDELIVNQKEDTRISFDQFDDYFPFDDSDRFIVKMVEVNACTRSHEITMNIRLGKRSLEFKMRGLDIYITQYNMNAEFDKFKNVAEFKKYHTQVILECDKVWDAPRRRLLEHMKAHFRAEMVDGRIGPASHGGGPTTFSYTYKQFDEAWLNFDKAKSLYLNYKKRNKKNKNN